MQRRDDLTIFILTTGEESLDECMDSIKRQRLSDNTEIKIEVIKDVYPVHVAFNEMHRRCRTPYFIQVDADVILKDGAIDALYQAIKRSNFFIFERFGQLYEEGFGVGGRVRCRKKWFFNIFKFKDKRTTDRDIYRKARLLGFREKQVDSDGVLGVHKPRQSDFSDYWKTKGDIEKWQYLGRPFKRYALGLYEDLIKDPHENRYKILGFALGVLTSKKRISKSKDTRVEKERIKDICGSLNIGFDRLPLKRDINFSHLLDIVRGAYGNYSPLKKKGFIKEVFRELFDIEPEGASVEGLYQIISR